MRIIQEAVRSGLLDCRELGESSLQDRPSRTPPLNIKFLKPPVCNSLGTYPAERFTKKSANLKKPTSELTNHLQLLLPNALQHLAPTVQALGALGSQKKVPRKLSEREREVSGGGRTGGNKRQELPVVFRQVAIYQRQQTAVLTSVSRISIDRKESNPAYRT